MKYYILILLQCPARWTNVQAVVSPGANPLPAEVRMKRRRENGEEFYFVDQLQWETSMFPIKTYGDPIQENVRKMVGRCLVLSFGLFEYKQDTDVRNYVPKLPLPHDACIHKLIDIVRAQQATCVFEIDQDEDLDDAQKDAKRDRFITTCDRITNGFIATQLLGTLSTLQVGKNWNSHGATLGASVCQLAALLSSLDTANSGAHIPREFPVLIPRGNVQTGHKYGHHDVCYVEYMTAAKEKLVVTGGEQNYLNHGTFVRDKHGAKVRAIMDRTLATTDAPIPRPTRSHTFDFNLTYAGARLIDGECKGHAAEYEKAVLVLHSLEQLALKETALGMLTTNNSFILYRSKILSGPRTIQTKYDESNKYDLGPISDIANDAGADIPGLEEPPTFDAGSDALCRVVKEEDAKVLECWSSLRSEIRRFLCAVLWAIDVLSAELTGMDVEEVRQGRQEAYEQGWGEPSFSATANADLRSKRPIDNQDDFIYCKRTMDPVGAQQDAIIAAGLAQDYRSTIQNNPQLSQEVRAAFETSIQRHSSP